MTEEEFPATHAFKLVGYEGKTVEDLKDFIVAYVEKVTECMPTDLRELNRRFYRTCQRHETTLMKVLKELEADARLFARFSVEFKKTFIYSKPLWGMMMENLKDSHGDSFENMERALMDDQRLRVHRRAQGLITD